jgi:hypothetical protein
VTFYILLSTVAILTAVVGCAVIWGYDIVRAKEVERDVRTPERPLELARVRKPELEPGATE